MDSEVTILSMNCQGLAGEQKRRDVFHYLREKKHSIFLLQDTHFTSKLEKRIKAEWGYQCYFSSFSSGSRGVAILFNNNFEFKVKRVCRDGNGNYLFLALQIKGHDILLVNIYGPNKDDPEFYRKIKQIVREWNYNYVIMAGDWNLVLEPSSDYNNYKHINNPKAQRIVEEIIDDLDMCDIWRDLNPDCRRYTWHRRKPFQQARLDYFLISDHVMSIIKDADINTGYRTDHSAIILKLNFGPKINYNTYWKFNTSLLKDKKYIDEVNKTIHETIAECSAPLDTSQSDVDNIQGQITDLVFSVPDEVFLDFLLMKIREKTITFAKKKKKQTNEEEKKLDREIQNLEFNAKSEHDFKQIKDKKTQLEYIREKRMEGVLLRSKARWISEGEKVSKYFCNLENRHFVSKNMSKLVDDNGNKWTDNKDILQIVKQFYESLYKKRHVEECEISDLVKEIPQLSFNEAKDLEGEITLEEASYALKNMKNNKSPGSDGFGAEFFKMFWGKIGALVVRALNASFRKGELSNTQKEGVVICIPKADKPREYIKNWRPITLLNVIYKIGSASIANRIKRVLPKIINDDQTGFIAGRYIGDNIRLIYDLIAYLNEKNLPGLLINIDFEKAFDSVDWDFMFKVLRAFGFQNDICRWIGTFYKKIKSSVVMNGQASSWFDIQRGCRQGDPISPYLFILCVEILGIMTRENKNMRGIKINDDEIKISQYADDTEFILEGDETSFESCIGMLEKFGRVSGLNLNEDKTSAVWLGKHAKSPVRYMQHLKFNWNPSTFKVLGIWFLHNLNQCVEQNYEHKFAEAKRLCRVWMKRQLTPLGRLAILKSLILSKLIYLWILLPRPPEQSIANLQKLCYTFVWNNKRDKISRKVSHKNIEMGGFGLPHISTFIKALKLTWIRKLAKTEHKWKHIVLAKFPFLDKLKEYGPEIGKLYEGNKFWAEVISAYANFYYTVLPKSAEELLSEPVRYNNRITVGGRVLKNNKWLKHICNIANFIQEDGTFMSHSDFQRNYNINMDYVTYTGCILSIKRYIAESKISIVNNNNNTTNVHVGVKAIHSIHRGSKLYYNIFTQKESEPNCCQKWEEKLNNSNINWERCFHLMSKIKDTRLKWFQLRTVHRIIGTNVILKEMGIVSDNKCSFCSEYRDSIQHFMWECTVTKLFWNDFKNVINNKCVELPTLTLSDTFVLFGVDKDKKTDFILYFIILLAKQYVYNCKLDKSIPCLHIFQKKLLKRYRMEDYNARVKKTSRKLFPISGSIICLFLKTLVDLKLTENCMWV